MYRTSDGYLHAIRSCHRSVDYLSGMAVTLTGVSLYIIALVALMQIMMIWTGQKY
jgi:hypothetical protein